MMNKALLYAAASLVALALGSVAAQAQTANFLGSTLGASKCSSFKDNGSTCPGGAAPTQFQWTFVEDGVTGSGSSVIHHFEASFCAYTVKLTITCPDGSTATKTRFACFSCGVPGCIQSDAGYN